MWEKDDLYRLGWKFLGNQNVGTLFLDILHNVGERGI